LQRRAGRNGDSSWNPCRDGKRNRCNPLPLVIFSPVLDAFSSTILFGVGTVVAGLALYGLHWARQQDRRGRNIELFSRAEQLFCVLSPLRQLSMKLGVLTKRQQIPIERKLVWATGPRRCELISHKEARRLLTQVEDVEIIGDMLLKLSYDICLHGKSEVRPPG